MNRNIFCCLFPSLSHKQIFLEDPELSAHETVIEIQTIAKDWAKNLKFI